MAARLSGGACEITIIHSGNDRDETVYSRPNIRHVHQLLQITEDELHRQAGAEMILALPYQPDSQTMFYVPLGDYGAARSGCDFQHYWRRAHAAGHAEEMEHYNFALRLNAAGLALAQAPKGLPVTDLAYKFKTRKYTQLLTNIAKSIGPLNLHIDDALDVNYNGDGRCQLSLQGRAVESDLILDMRDNERARNYWAHNYISIHPNDNLPGLSLYVVQSAIDRLFSLWPDLSDNLAEQKEYNRLAVEEKAHVDDMMALLSGQKNVFHGRDRLMRKIELFQSRGRVTLEDYDVFSKAEWIAAFRASGVYQMGYDRLADRESLDDIRRWLAEIDHKIDAQMNALKGNLA